MSAMRLVGVLVLTLLLLGLSAPVNAQRLRPVTDPLPPGALARFGSDRLRIGGQPQGIAFASDGKTLAGSGADGTVRLWDVATGKEVRVLRPFVWTARYPIFSADGNLLATGSDKGVVLWNAITNKELHRLESGVVEAIALAPDGKLLAVGCMDGSVWVFDTTAGKTFHQLNGHKHRAWSLAFSPDGKSLATGSADGNLRFWDLATGKQKDVWTLKESNFFSIAFLPDSATILAGGYDGKVRFWDTRTKKEVNAIAALRGGLTRLALSGDGKTLATTSAAEKSIRLWDAATGKPLREITGLAKPAMHLAMSPDGRTLATASFAGTRVQLWDADTGQELHPADGHTAGLTAVHLSPDGKKLISGGFDTTALVWDVESLLGRPAVMKELGENELRRLWDDLAGSDPAAAHSAVWELARQPKTIAFLKERLDGKQPDALAEQVGKLVAALDDDDFTVRENATEELRKMGSAAESSLRKALAKNPPLEARRRIETVLKGLMPQGGDGPSAEALRAMRVVHVLERIGTAEAKELLQALTRKPSASREAKEALERIGKRSGTSRE